MLQGEDQPVRKISIAAVMLATSYTAPAFSQAPPPPPESQSPSRVSFGQLQPTERMWFYEQQQRAYADRKLAVRKKAEVTYAQRRARIAARKWFGFSNARPVASPMPWYRPYSPGWIGNSHDPSHWAGYGHTPIVLRPIHVDSGEVIGLW